jgi:hypothetical protein
MMLAAAVISVAVSTAVSEGQESSEPRTTAEGTVMVVGRSVLVVSHPTTSRQDVEEPTPDTSRVRHEL